MSLRCEMENPLVISVIRDLYDIQAVKFGTFTLKSGVESPVYFDLRVIVSYPDIMKRVAQLLYEKIKDVNFELLCGVPYTALPIATCMSVAHNIPMVMRRKEAKSYGTKKMIEGKFSPSQKCLIVEDVVTSGSSVLETVSELKAVGLNVTDAVVLLDREQGGEEKLLQEGIKLHSLIKMTALMAALQEHSKVSADICNKVIEFITSNKAPSTTKLTEETKLSYKERCEMAEHPVTKQLLSLMDEKKTNLCVAADATDSEQLLKIVEAVGPHICLLKTHIDVISDFNETVCVQLLEAARKHKFLIFEDRKFADIGNTVHLQYSKSIFRIVDWADMVTAHPLPGPGMIQGLLKDGLSKGRACLLVAEMSSSGNLGTKEYTEGALKMAQDFPDFIIGFISQSRISNDPRHVHLTPGVKINLGEKESLGQQYVSPECAITERGADVIIVGRGITEASDISEAAKQYKTQGFQAYEKMFKK